MLHLTHGTWTGYKAMTLVDFRDQEDLKPLREYGVTASSRILVLGVPSTEAQSRLAEQEARGREQQEREVRLQRLKLAAEALAKRSNNE